MLRGMGTRETRAQRGRRLGTELLGAVIGRLRDARVVNGISQADLALALGISQQHYSRIELGRVRTVSLIDLATIASVLGLEPSLTFHHIGPAIRDKGHEALIGRLLKHLAPTWHVLREAPFFKPGRSAFVGRAAPPWRAHRWRRGRDAHP